MTAVKEHAGTGGEASAEALRAGLWVLAALHLGLGVVMAIAPHAFYKAIGPFEAFNRHYIRDVSTFYLALGFGFAVATRRRSWRVPVIAVTTVQFALHTANHLIDATKAHPEWTGWFDVVSLLASTLLLAWMWRAAARGERTTAGATLGAVASPTPVPAERSVR